MELTGLEGALNEKGVSECKILEHYCIILRI